MIRSEYDGLETYHIPEAGTFIKPVGYVIDPRTGAEHPVYTIDAIAQAAQQVGEASTNLYAAPSNVGVEAGYKSHTFVGDDEPVVSTVDAETDERAADRREESVEIVDGQPDRKKRKQTDESSREEPDAEPSLKSRVAKRLAKNATILTLGSGVLASSIYGTAIGLQSALGDKTPIQERIKEDWTLDNATRGFSVIGGKVTSGIGSTFGIARSNDE